MDPPRDTTLPFFSYGIFKPGELGHYQIKDFVIKKIESDICGKLMIRDGLPLLYSIGGRIVNGYLLYFNPERSLEAYSRICNMEPDHQYRWEVRKTDCGDVNVLEGRYPNRGSDEFVGRGTWEGRTDPLFTTALDIVSEMLDQNIQYTGNLKNTLRLEMAYLLLWTSIERYVSFRYNLEAEPNEKLRLLSNDVYFKECLESLGIDRREIYRADKPSEKCILDRRKPEKAAEYYYQVRCNIAHRGKAIYHDHDVLVLSITELLNIQRYVLDHSFVMDADV